MGMEKDCCLLDYMFEDIFTGMGCDMLPCIFDPCDESEDEDDIVPDRFPDEITDRIRSGEITAQKSWKYIKELNSFSEERLDKTALTDCRRDYTYRQLFRKWERYAAVFSAVGITGSRHSRVAMIGTPATEVISAFYGLNMTGTSVSIVPTSDYHFTDRWKKLVEKEGITDIFLNDIVADPEMVRGLLDEKENMGIRNIIVIHIPLSVGDMCSPDEKARHRKNIAALKKIDGVLFMKDLLEEYRDHPVEYAETECDEAAVIIHTSGTVNGIHKPVPLSDTALNESVDRLIRDERFAYLNGRAVSCLNIEIQSSYFFIDGMHLPLAFGGRTVLISTGARGMVVFNTISEYKVNVMFVSAIELELLLKLPITPDFSHLEFIFFGGSYCSVDNRRRYNKFLKKCGSKAKLTVGYGMSEAGAACILSTQGRKDDAMGYPLSGVKVKIYDEDEDKYYDIEDGPASGLMYISSKSLSGGRIDDRVFFELTDIDGVKYLNTNDRARVNEDGSLTYIGRVNKYFINHEGIRFNAGLIETAVSAEPGIETCGLVPEYNKFIHDSFPVLYVKATKEEGSSRKTVRRALKNVFIRDGKAAETNLPGQCVLTDNIPFNDGGKVDVYRILNEGVKGRRYSIVPEKEDGELKDIRLVPVEKIQFFVKMGLPEEIEDEMRETGKAYGKNAINQR